MEDRKSWLVKDEAVLDDLTTLMQLTDAEKSVLAGYQEQAKGVTDEMMETFYGRLLKHANTAEYLDGKVERVKHALSEWFVQLFSGHYDQTYVQSRLKIGRLHVQIGLPVRYPLAMMDVMLHYGHRITAGNTVAEDAFSKLLALDIAIFNQAYEDSQLQHLAEMVGNERLARRLLTQEAAV